MSALKDRVKSASYALGPLGLYHVLLNRARLTVVMFHRILPRGAPERACCDLDYVLDAEIFEQCLGFFSRHYNVVSLTNVIAATRGGALPGWPLLITFDDGWADTLTYAAPLLARHNLPGVCFVVSDVLAEPAASWWQNSYALAWRKQRVEMPSIESEWKQLGAKPAPDMAANPYLAGLAMLAELPVAARSQLLERWTSDIVVHGGRQMLAPEQLRELRQSGVDVGAHGASHVPMTLSRDRRGELNGARTRLRSYLQSRDGADVAALSFPHGRFDDAVVAGARDSGYAVMFTSAPQLTELTGGRLSSDVCGRIEIATRHVAPEGTFRPDLLACHLFLRNSAKTPAEAMSTGATIQ